MTQDYYYLTVTIPKAKLHLSKYIIDLYMFFIPLSKSTLI